MNWDDGRPVEMPTDLQQRVTSDIANATFKSGLREAITSKLLAELSPATREIGYVKYLVHFTVALMKKRGVGPNMIRMLMHDWIDEEIAAS